MQRIRREYHFGRLTDCYADRPANVNELLARSVALSRDEPAVADGDLTLTYAQLSARICTLAASLAARGVGPGDRVAVMLPNCLEAALALMAISHLGAIVVPIGTRLRRPEIAYIFDDSTPVAMVHGAAFADELPENGPDPAMRFACDGEGWQALLQPSPGSLRAAAEVAEEDVFGILYTSGTTGRPKGAMITHLNVVHSCLHWEHVHRMTRGERTILCVPWSHVAGLCGAVIPFLHVGGLQVMLADFDRRRFLDLAERVGITHALMVPAMYGLCLLEPDLAKRDLGSWRLGVYGGAPMPLPTIERFAKALPGLQMCNAYGATETTSPATIMPPGDGLEHAESIGRTVPCGDIRVMDETGCEVPPGEDGELWIAGPMIVPGYWKNSEADADAFAGGYWKSGDIGSIDSEGFVRIADRKKDMINRGGFKVYPAEVESVLTGIEGVVEAAVVGRPDPILGERVVAFLNINAGVETEAVREFCFQRMADYKVPDDVVIGREPLPRNANGKIQKAELRGWAQALRPRAG